MNNSHATLWDRFKAFLFHLFPHHWVSRITFWATRRQSFLIPHAIKTFINFFKVEMEDAETDDIRHYKTFNDFFTRTLKNNARPIDEDPDSVVSPCDGTISMHGPIDQDSLIQAKNKFFSIEDFCTPSSQFSEQFIDGYFCTIYLSPRDYHRVHMPYHANLQEMIYVPGRLFSVAPYAPKTIDKLFARNERVIPIFKFETGYMAVAMVGAVNVAAIEMTWSGMITPPQKKTAVRYGYSASTAVKLQKGDHMGTFNMGSTVVLMFSRNSINPSTDLAAQQKIKMGQRLGSIAKY